VVENKSPRVDNAQMSLRRPPIPPPEKKMRLLVVSVVLVTLAVLPVTSAEKKKEPAFPPDPNIASSDPRTPAEERKALRVPEGFEVQLVAAEPDIHKPINMAFDARGRLWVTQSVEYPFAARQGVTPKDRVSILEDFGPDGRARKITHFAGELNIPIGVLPLEKGALVYSIPNVWRLTDTTGRGKADKREVVLGLYGHRDTHGMTGEFTMGFDGWVYACHGYANTSTVKAADGSRITMNSGNTYRFKPDGSHVEYFTHGQVNPFGLAWDPFGNLYSCDCHSQPIYQLLRGAYYPSFGKPDDGLGFGPEMFTNYRDSTAIAGIAYYAADHFPNGYRDCAFIGDVVTNNIVQFDVAWTGASPRATLRYFLKSEDRWFRPVAIVLGPDGALYVADFYNRIIGHYEVPLQHPGRDRERGRIWRIVYKGKDGKGEARAPRADWTSATVKELVQDLAHPNLTVRMTAMNQLVERGQRAVAAVRDVMRTKSTPAQRAHGLWVLQRLNALDGKTLADSARDEDRLVRIHAMRVLGERPKLSEGLHALACAGLNDKDPLVQRAAAEALGRHPSVANLGPLLGRLHAVPHEDTHLLHTVRMALRDQLVPVSTWAGVDQKAWSEKDKSAIADVCLGVPTPEAATFLLAHLRRRQLRGPALYRLAHHVARYHPDSTNADLLAHLRKLRANPMEQRDLFQALQRGTQERGATLSPAARGWGEGLTRALLDSRRKQDFLAGIELAGSLRLKETNGILLRTAVNHKESADRRLAAFTALVAIDPKGSIGLLGKILGDSGESISVREQAAGLLGKLNQPAAHEELVKTLPAATARLQSVIALELARSRTGAEKLLEAVATGKASARVLQDRLVELRLQESKLPDLKPRLAKLTAGLPAADQSLHDLIKQRREGYLKARTDVARGAKVFEKSCAICHILDNKGAKIGPQLDGIGIRGLDRLLEDILDPNLNVDQAFRLTTLYLRNGKIESGLLLKKEGQVYVLADAKGKEVRVPKNEVDEKKVSQISPMPADFEKQIPEKEFYDLLAYLLAQKASPK
jgi:putative heme-binding domain-containing protein